jgi:hypothetical protein
MDKIEASEVEVKVSWGLVWNLWWRMTLITLGACFVVYLILFLSGVAFAPW